MQALRLKPHTFHGDWNYTVERAARREPRAPNLNCKFVVPQALDRFDAADRAYRQHQTGVAEKSTVALEMRNLVDAVQGELFDAVPKPVRGRLTWSVMVDSLIPAEPGSTPSELVRRQEEVRHKLYEELSNALKRREGQREQHVDDLWTRVLDHLLIVLSVFEVQWAGRRRAVDQKC